MEEESYNPLDFFCPNLVDLILQHLTVKQILSLSESSPDFQKFISSNQKFMKSVKIHITANQSVTDKDFCVFIKRIRRSYQNFHFDGTESISKLNLVAKYFKAPVKRVKISNMIFNRPTLLQKFIDDVRSSLEEIQINSVYIFNCDKKITMSFVKLKHLEMMECNDQEDTFIKRISFVITESRQLESLKLMYAGVSEDNERKLLMENEKIKNLILADLKDSFFLSLDRSIKFKLEKFTMNFSSEDRYRLKPNFGNFLRSQRENLLYIEFSGWISPEVLEIIYNMPKLQYLKISRAKKWILSLSSSDIEDKLNTSFSLKELILTDDLVQQQNLWHIFLKHAPKLNRFQLFNSSYYP